MAVYYINANTTFNGNGTYSNAWSLSSSVRTGLTSNDEIRILGVTLANLLLPTVYTATVNSTIGILTIASGGNRGLDFQRGSIIYFPEYDSFARIISSTSNVISISSGVFPIYNTAVTSVTVQKANASFNGSYYGPASTASYDILPSAASLSNVTVSDCWVDDTTRITDGSVRTLVYTSFTSAGIVLNLNGPSSTNSKNFVFNLQNTHFLCANAAGTTSITTNLLASNTIINLGQLFYNATTGGFIPGASTNPVSNVTFNLTHGPSGELFQVGYGKNITVNVLDMATSSMDGWFGFGQLAGVNYINYTFNFINNLVIWGYSSITNTLMINTGMANSSFNYFGTVDIYQNSTLTTLYNGSGYVNMYFGPNFSVKYNRRISTQTSITNRNLYGASNKIQGNIYYFPLINLPSGWTSTNITNLSGILQNGSLPKISRIPNIYYVDMPTPISSTVPYGITNGTNHLVNYRDGSNPIEILSPHGNNYAASGVSTTFPIVSIDNSVYRKTGPSLKSYLATRTALYWGSNPISLARLSVATKPIKFPVYNGVPVTISGYIRTDDSVYANGDCDVSIYHSNTEVSIQSMTTNCINNWELFTLNYTPSSNGEAYFLWDMYYSNGAKSYWLDDLTITQ